MSIHLTRLGISVQSLMAGAAFAEPKCASYFQPGFSHGQHMWLNQCHPRNVQQTRRECEHAYGCELQLGYETEQADCADAANALIAQTLRETRKSRHGR